MKKLPVKIISFILTGSILFSMCVPVFGVETLLSTSNEFNNLNEFINFKVKEIENLADKETKTLKSVQNNNINIEANRIRGEVDSYLKAQDSKEIKENLEGINKLADSLEKLDKMTNKSQLTTNSLTGGAWRYGDILYYGIGSNNTMEEKSYVGHTAVLSITRLYVIEAVQTKAYGSKVMHWDREYIWAGCSGIKQLKVTSITGTDATPAERMTAVNYGKAQEGETYRLKTSLFTEDEWYCSKLTYRQWNAAGYDLRGTRGLTLSGFIIVMPDDIRIDINTRLYKDWGTTLPGLI